VSNNTIRCPHCDREIAIPAGGMSIRCVCGAYLDITPIDPPRGNRAAASPSGSGFSHEPYRGQRLAPFLISVSVVAVIAIVMAVVVSVIGRNAPKIPTARLPEESRDGEQPQQPNSPAPKHDNADLPEIQKREKGRLEKEIETTGSSPPAAHEIKPAPRPQEAIAGPQTENGDRHVEPREWYRAEWAGNYLFSHSKELDWNFHYQDDKPTTYTLTLRLFIRTPPDLPIKELHGHLAIVKDGKIIYETQVSEKPDISFTNLCLVSVRIDPYDDNNEAHRTLRFAKDNELTPTFTMSRVVLADGTVRNASVQISPDEITPPVAEQSDTIVPTGDDQEHKPDVDSTASRKSRWIVTYPTLPQAEYERMLDALQIEIGYLLRDRATIQYLANLSGVGKKGMGDAAEEDRMVCYWMSRTSADSWIRKILAAEHDRQIQTDKDILRNHGLEATSDVFHLYSKHLEQKLAEMERDYLRRRFKITEVERVATTNFTIIPGGPDGWHLEVTGLSLR
jgi:hypothetical protein